MGQDYTYTERARIVKFAGTYLFVKDNYYREKVYDFSPGLAVAQNLLIGGDLEAYPVYALRYAPADIEVIPGLSDPYTNGLKAEAKNIRGNGLRVAYRYSFNRRYLQIESCAVGADPTISTAKDLKDKNYFTTHSSKVKTVKYPFVGGEFLSPTQNSLSPLTTLWKYRTNGQTHITDPSVPASHADLRRIRPAYPTSGVYGMEPGATKFTRMPASFIYTNKYTVNAPYRWVTDPYYAEDFPSYIQNSIDLYDRFVPITLVFDYVPLY